MSSRTEEIFFKGGMRIREILQAIEDALIDRGYDHYMIATEHGPFSGKRWIERVPGKPANHALEPGSSPWPITARARPMVRAFRFPEGPFLINAPAWTGERS
jgi:hypothetical protein